MSACVAAISPVVVRGSVYDHRLVSVILLPVQSPPTRAPNAGGVIKIGDFRQITGYISNTVKDRHVVSIKVE